jgi:hypothetical protein
MDTIFFVIIAAVVLIVVWSITQRRKRQTPRSLTFAKVPATVTKIEETKGTRIVRMADGTRGEAERISYVVVAQGRHPNNNAELTFRSFPLTEYPRNYPVGKEITVALDLANPHNYKMQIK